MDDETSVSQLDELDLSFRRFRKITRNVDDMTSVTFSLFIHGILQSRVTTLRPMCVCYRHYHLRGAICTPCKM